MAEIAKCYVDSRTLALDVCLSLYRIFPPLVYYLYPQPLHDFTACKGRTKL